MFSYESLVFCDHRNRFLIVETDFCRMNGPHFKP